jgi:Predicted metalloendopeptidase
MVRLILDETYKYLSTVDWMDPTTRLAAQDKVKAIIPYVAYPQELLGKSTLLSRHVMSRDSSVAVLNEIAYNLRPAIHYQVELRGTTDVRCTW